MVPRHSLLLGSALVVGLLLVGSAFAVGTPEPTVTLDDSGGGGTTTCAGGISWIFR